jgi:hypothetical protein
MQGPEAAYFYLALIGYIVAGVFLIVSAVLFFSFDIRGVLKDKGGMLEQKQIEEIRAKNAGAAKYRGKVNVFEDLEKRAKPKRSNSGSLRIGTTGGSSAGISAPAASTESATTLLEQPAKAVNPNFIIERNIMFVSTSEVI